MDNYHILARVLLIVVQCYTAASLQQCCNGLEPDIPKFCFNNDPPFEGPFVAKCMEDIPFVKFVYYTKDDRTVGQEISRNNIPSNFDQTSVTTFLAHGWGSSSGFEPLRDSILDVVGGTVIHIKWDGGSLDPNYLQSAADTLTVAKEITIIRTILINKFGMQQSLFRCIGHSLGGQICGRAGNMMKFGKITAMDPAGPDFEGRAPEGRLSTASAEIVIVIHTACTGSALLKLGMYEPCGHIDFYPNGGGNQPECRLGLSNILGSSLDILTGGPNIMDLLTDDLTLKCSHSTSWRLMIESLISKKCVSRESCTDYKNIPGSCGPATSEPLQVIGHTYAYPARGVFYLTTNNHEPYCKG